MDRDKRWDRVERAYDIIAGPVSTAHDAVAYIEGQYAEGVTDEFVVPASILHEGARVRIDDGDSIVFFSTSARTARGR